MGRLTLLACFFTFSVTTVASWNQKWLDHAAEIESSINSSQNPCEDFYEFACGGWKAINPIPPGASNWNQESIYLKDQQRLFAEIIEAPFSPDDTLTYRAMKTIYRNCMDSDRRMNFDLKYLSKLIDQIGNWPIATPPGTILNISSGVINNILAPAKQLFGTSVLFNAVVDVNPFLGFKYRLLLNRAKTPLQHILSKYARDSPEIRIYAENIKAVVILFSKARNFDPIIAEIDEDISKMIDFQLKIIEIWERTKNSRKNRDAIWQFQSWYDSLLPKENAKASWIDYFKVILKPINITDEQEVVNENLNYIDGMVRLLDSTPFRTIHNFAIWNIFYQILKHLPENMENIRQALDNIGKDVPSIPKDRKSRCMLDLPYQHALMAEYVKKHFTRAVKNSVWDIVGDIAEFAMEYIQKTRWLTRKQKGIMVNEISKITWQIGYPDWYDDISAIDKFYENPSHENGNYLENRFQFSRFEARTMFSRINKDANRTQKWLTDKATDMNALFRKDSSITVTAALLLQPAFNPSYPMTINYGSIATILAHEMSHLFDSMNVHLNDAIRGSWSTSTYTEFNSRAECLQNQYNKYTIYSSPNLTIKGDGERSLSENIADCLGTKIAFLAYEKYKNPQEKEVRLPNLGKYNDRQLFFLSLANRLCSLETPQFYSDRMDDFFFGYSFNKWRVNGAVSNMKEFSDAFSCPLSSAMNPQKKCVLYGPEA